MQLFFQGLTADKSAVLIIKLYILQHAAVRFSRSVIVYNNNNNNNNM